MFSVTEEGCLSRCSIAISRYHDYGNSYKRKHLLGLADSFIGLVHSHHCSVHAGIQAAMVLEKKLRVLLPNPQTARIERLWAWLGLLNP